MKKFVIILSCFIISIVFSGCVKKTGTTVNVDVRKPGEAECEWIDSITARFDCYFNVGKDKKDISYCKTLKSEGIEACYSGVAEAMKDPAICKEIKDEHTLDSCYYKVADVVDNVNKCKDIPSESASWQANCYERIAKLEGDIEICKQIQNAARVDLCYSSVAAYKKDSSMCDIIKDTKTKDSCYLKVAVNACDASICNKMSDEAGKTLGSSSREDCKKQVETDYYKQCGNVNI